MDDKLVRASDIFPALQSAGVPYNYATQRVIEQLPAVDAVEVVRCRECRYFCKGENDSESWEWCDCWKKDCWEDCYCACGQRREDGDA